MTSPRPSAVQKFLVALVAGTLTLQPLSVYAVTITSSYLNEIPLQGLKPVKPNIVFTVDDSGSMTQEYLPDFSLEGPIGSVAHYCRDDRYCGVDPPSLNFVISPLGLDPPVRSSNQNKQYYDPFATYVAGRHANGSSLPYEASSPNTGTAVYPNGYAGYPGTNTSVPVNLLTGYPDTAWCNTLAPSAQDIATAFTDGSKCRLNGRRYSRAVTPNGDVTPSIEPGYNYPNRRDVATGGNTACANAEHCDFTTPVAVTGNPYYYVINKVQFCPNKDVLGFGIAGTAPCQDRWDENNFRYVRYGNSSQSLDPAAFTRYDITPAGILVNGVLGTNPSGRSPADELANFAKWYAFYRDRISAIKSAGGLAFSNLTDDDARVGFHTLHENASLFLNVKPFVPGPGNHKDTWFNNFYKVVPPPLGTPLPDAVFRIGEYFANSGLSGLPGATDPLDRDTGQCQLNYHLLATDGYWNNAIPYSGRNFPDKDGTVPATLPASIPPTWGWTPGLAFPAPYFEGPTATSNSLADLAMHYWITDLRPMLADKVDDDPVAKWQHVTLYGVSQGAQGNIPYPSGLADIKSGARQWPPALGAGGPESVDDLWHAALNSQGDFATAQNPQELARTMRGWIENITSQAGTGTAVGIAGAQLTATRNAAYKASYAKGWWGDVTKYNLDPNTGKLVVDITGKPIPVWTAAAQLDAMVLANGWKNKRRIVTAKDSGIAGTPFLLANLNSAQQDSLIGTFVKHGDPVPTRQSVLDFLRGDTSNAGVSVTSLRPRDHILGDIVYSGAVPVGTPSQPYTDAGNPGYQQFVLDHTAPARRTPMVYVGANDGMVHAFDDTTGSSAAGSEVWAYVPKVLFTGGDPNDSTHTPDPDFQLGALSYAGIAGFHHKFYVNATPRAWDIDFANTGTNSAPQSGNDWRTVLVGGLGAGGRAVYALDITNPPLSTETEGDVAGRVLWEFTDDADLGYVFDTPTLVKTKAYGWVALVASGYNSKSGRGFLFVINPKTGQLVHPQFGKLPLPGDTGIAESPTGLSTIRAYTASRRDPYVLQAYGGDLKGNVWRFDLSDINPANWSVAKIAHLTDGVNDQPITTGVRVEIDQNNNVGRYLFVGTGKLLGVNSALGVDDINSNTILNTMYVIKDGTVRDPGPVPTPPYSRSDLRSVNGSSVNGFSGPAVGRDVGWYQDAADLTEKVGTDAYADVQTVVWAFSKPNTTDPCEGLISSRLYARDLNTGASVLIPPNGGDVVAGYDINSGIAGVALIQGQAASSASANGDIKALVTTMKGEVFSFGIKPRTPPGGGHRVSWRLLNRD